MTIFNPWRNAYGGEKSGDGLLQNVTFLLGLESNLQNMKEILRYIYLRNVIFSRYHVYSLAIKLRMKFGHCLCAKLHHTCIFLMMAIISTTQFNNSSKFLLSHVILCTINYYLFSYTFDYANVQRSYISKSES